MHFQYTSALCIGAGAFVGWLTAPVKPHIHAPLLLLALTLLLAGVISDWRWHRFTDEVNRLFPAMNPNNAFERCRMDKVQARKGVARLRCALVDVPESGRSSRTGLGLFC